LWFDVDGPALVPDGPAMRERVGAEVYGVLKRNVFGTQESMPETTER
jgi:hypothetical protein